VFPETIRLAVAVPQPTIVAESNLADGTQQTVVGHPTGRSVSMSAQDDRTQHYEGRSSQGEGNVAGALHRLTDTLNQIAGSRVWRERVGSEDVATDGILKAADGRELDCQVTRVERRTLRARGSHGRATSHDAVEALAANVVVAVESKLDSADPGMFLVLDTNDAPACTDGPRVVEIARNTMGERGYLGRWNAVWLVGPTVARTTCIDPQ
jgi:hypothetical protein